MKTVEFHRVVTKRLLYAVKLMWDAMTIRARDRIIARERNCSQKFVKQRALQAASLWGSFDFFGLATNLIAQARRVFVSFARDGLVEL